MLPSHNNYCCGKRVERLRFIEWSPRLAVHRSEQLANTSTPIESNIVNLKVKINGQGLPSRVVQRSACSKVHSFFPVLVLGRQRERCYQLERIWAPGQRKCLKIIHFRIQTRLEEFGSTRRLLSISGKEGQSRRGVREIRLCLRKGGGWRSSGSAIFLSCRFPCSRRASPVRRAKYRCGERT